MGHRRGGRRREQVRENEDWGNGAGSAAEECVAALVFDALTYIRPLLLPFE